MTEKLYYIDAYMSEFTAIAVSSEKSGELYDTVLDRTAFFPEEGGQYADSGEIAGIRVLDVSEKDGVIHHYTEKEVPIGEPLFCKIDFDERYEKMQCHTAEHILSGLFHSLFGLDNVGFHLGKEEVTMDISRPLSKEELSRVECLANEIVYKNVEVCADFPSSEELSSLEYRSKLELTENVRIVKIGEYDSCACCAPHVKRTGEIGLIKILDSAKLRGGMRLNITAGRRAMRAFFSLYEISSSISAALSVPKSSIDTEVKKLLADKARAEAELSQYKISVMENEARKFAPTENNPVLHFDLAGFDELIAYSNIAIEKVSGILVLLSRDKENYRYVISSRTKNLREISADINKSLLGRGGGRPNMIQGSFSESLENIKEYFSRLT